MGENSPTRPTVERYGVADGLPELSALQIESYGTILYVASAKGVYRGAIPPAKPGAADRIRFSADPVLFRPFASKPISVSSLAIDRRGVRYLNTEQGVLRITPGEGGRFQVERNPFTGLPMLDLIVYLHPDGSVWIPGKDLYRVDPQAPKNYRQPFQTLIRRVTANARRAVFEGAHGRPGAAFGNRATLFTADQPPQDVPELPYTENAITFEFSAAFYEKPGGTSFQCYLEGFDEGWGAWSKLGSKEYTNLPEGSYRFRVRARNIYGAIGREAAFRLRILPPWYRTSWAYILWVILGGGLLIGAVRLYTFKLRRQKQILEDLVAERTRQLREASLTDPLTGLRNRRFISEILSNDVSAFVGFKSHLQKARNNRETDMENAVFGLFMVDIDHFKKVNDTYGHEAGDHVLKHFAAILSGSVRQDDTVLRMGGEEFLVVLKKTKPDYLPVFARKILDKVAATQFDLGDGSAIHKTCSIGYVAFPLYPENPELLTFEQSIMVADLGLYHAKKNGRNQAVRVAAGPNEPDRDDDTRMKAVTSLEFALGKGYLRIGTVIPGGAES